VNAFVAEVAAPLIAVSVLVLALLSTVLVAARRRRAYREDRRRADRALILAALTSGDARLVVHVVQQATASGAVREQLVEALRVAPSTLPRISEVDASGLAAVCVAETRHRNAVRRALGAELLAQVGSEAELADVTRLLHDDPDPEVRRVAARGLARRGDEAAAWRLITALVEAVLPPDRILEQLGHAFATPTLVDALHLEQLRPVHADLVEALGLARDQRAVFAVARLLRDGTERERIKACRALGRIGRDEVVPMLIEALSDASEVVRAVAARALGEIGDKRAVPKLAQHLADPSWWVRANAAEALRWCGPTGIAALTAALGHRSQLASARAAEALALHRAAAGRRRVA
jgi:HEAT repeat protein